MDYNKIKLGLIDRFKVWRVKREAEKTREWRDSIEHEISEVDYSEAERLEADLLEQKRIKRATKDATRLYKRVYGKNNDGIGETDFIEDYLVENGLKQKVLPEPEKTKKHSFMEQYTTEKSEEELAYEKATKKQEPEVYYKIGDTAYKTSFLFTDWCFKEINNGKDSPVPLTTNDEKAYFIQEDKMQPEDKYNMLKKLIDTSLTQMTMVLADTDEKYGPDSPFPTLCRQASYIDYAAKKLHESGKIEEAITKLEKMNEKIFKYYDKLLQSEQEESRE